MRIVYASLKDVYAVHKTYLEFISDNGCQTSQQDLYSVWPIRLTDPSFRYILLMHSRKVIGMLWGRELIGETRKTFLVEGRFLRRAYRGKFRFLREIFLASKELTKDFERVLVIVAAKNSTLKKGKLSICSIVENSK